MPTSRSITRVLFASLAAGLGALTATAQTLAAPPSVAPGNATAASPAAGATPLTGNQAALAFPHGLWLVSDENDSWFGTDRDLTSDLRLGYTTPNYRNWQAAPVIPAAVGNLFDRTTFMDDPLSLVAESFYAQQNMYTPSNLRIANPHPNDRPYAGWTGLGINLIRQDSARRANVELNLGWVGPESGAADLQKAWHNTIGATYPQGWGYQLKNEPVIQITYRQDWRVPVVSNLGQGNDSLGHDVIVHGALTAGNGWDYVATGFLARAGFHLPQDYGPARLRLGEVATLPYPAGALAPTSPDGWSAYFCIGGEDRAVARDITLDGNTFAKSRSVTKEPVVAEAYSGFVGEYAGAYAALLASFETENFRSQLAPQWRLTFTFGYAY